MSTASLRRQIERIKRKMRDGEPKAASTEKPARPTKVRIPGIVSDADVELTIKIVPRRGRKAYEGSK